VPNCEVHVAKSAFPSDQFHTTKAPLPNCQVQICFVNRPQHEKFLGCPMSKFFWSAETSAQKNQTLSKFKLPSKLNVNILRAYSNILSSHFIFLTSIFMNDVDLKAS
jgi:hypothetical protein